MPEDGLHFEVDSDGGHECGRERVIGVSEEEARLAHARVADDEQFEHVVKVLIGCIFLPLGISTAGHLEG